MSKRSVFFISDGTGITAETLGHSLMTQFDTIECDTTTIPYINNLEKAKNVCEQINKAATRDASKPLVFATLLDNEVCQEIKKSHCMFLDLFNTFLKPLEQELHSTSSYRIGKSHSVSNTTNYKLRIDAVNYALSNDDGAGQQNYAKADVIIVGVSRCGKTPTCLYLALQFGIYAANYPLTEEDNNFQALPVCLQTYRKKLFGLNIDTEQLQLIRSERRPDSEYASIKRCRLETQESKSLFQRERIPTLDATTRSIEEIATKIIEETGIKRRVF